MYVYADYALIRSLTMGWTGEADRRVAAIALAIRLYRADHLRWPSSLRELVPAYLREVPADPFSPGAPIGYVVRKGAAPGGQDRPLLYFNYTGDPQQAPLPSEPSLERPTHWSIDMGPQHFDQWRDLSRWYPSTVPADGSAQ
jgi:hypothetical protein